MQLDFLDGLWCLWLLSGWGVTVESFDASQKNAAQQVFVILTIWNHAILGATQSLRAFLAVLQDSPFVVGRLLPHVWGVPNGALLAPGLWTRAWFHWFNWVGLYVKLKQIVTFRAAPLNSSAAPQSFAAWIPMYCCCWACWVFFSFKILTKSSQQRTSPTTYITMTSLCTWWWMYGVSIPINGLHSAWRRIIMMG